MLLLGGICRLGSFGREHAPVKEKHSKKEKDKHKDHKEKSGKDKSPLGDVVLRPRLSWDSSQGPFVADAKLCCRHSLYHNSIRALDDRNFMSVEHVEIGKLMRTERNKHG